MRVLFIIVAGLILAAAAFAGLYHRATERGDRSPSTAIDGNDTGSLGGPTGRLVEREDARTDDDPARRDALELNDRAIELVDRGDLEGAIRLFTRAHELAPDDEAIRANLASAHNRRGLELMTAGDAKGARTAFARAVELVGDRVVFQLNHAIAQFALKEYEAAAEEIEALLVVAPGDPDVLDYRARLLYRENDLDGAVTAWAKAAAARPDDRGLLGRLEKARRERDAESSMTRDVGSKFAIKFEGGTNDVIARAVIEYLEDAYRSIGYALGHYPEDRVEVILYTREQFKEASEAASWVGGLFDGKIRLPVANFDVYRDKIRRVVVHEYVHVVVKELAPQCPIWLNEGIAQVLEGGSPQRSDPLVRATVGAGSPLLTLDEMRLPFVRIRDPELARLAYAQSLSFVAWLMRDAGDQSVADYLRAVADGKAHGAAFEEAFRRTEREADGRWREEMR